MSQSQSLKLYSSKEAFQKDEEEDTQKKIVIKDVSIS